MQATGKKAERTLREDTLNLASAASDAAFSSNSTRPHASDDQLNTRTAALSSVAETLAVATGAATRIV